MKSMFYNAVSFDQDVGRWNTDEVRDMSNMFRNATSLQRLSNMYASWNTFKVQDMSSMFQYASSFGGFVSRFDTSHVVDMSSMFNGAVSLQTNLSDWCVDMVRHFSNFSVGADIAKLPPFGTSNNCLRSVDLWECNPRCEPV